MSRADNLDSSTKLIGDYAAGADPEVFIKKGDDVVVSLDLIGGSKEDPKILSKADGRVFAAQEDNVLGEFNIPPTKSQKEFVDAIKQGLELFKAALPAGHTPYVATSHFFSPDQLVDPRAKMFGCDPDYNAWTRRINPRPPQPPDGLRSSGGHFHLGYTISKEALKKNNFRALEYGDINPEIVKWADLFCGVPSMQMDTDNNRRRLYGKAGAYRNKNYGVEYRTLSSFWLKSEELMGWVYSQMMRAADRVANLDFLDEATGAMIAEVINTPLTKKTESLIKTLNERHGLVTLA